MKTSAPISLSKEASIWWGKLLTEYGIKDEEGLLLLQTALESFDLMRKAQRRVDRDGLMIKDRFGQSKAHPLMTVIRDSRSQMLLALKALNLDTEPLGPGG